MTAFPTLDYLDYAVAKACDCVAAGNLAREHDKTVDVPARHYPLVVVGPSGCGKSQWLKNFLPVAQTLHRKSRALGRPRAGR